MSRSALAGIIGLLAITGLGSTPASAGGYAWDYYDEPPDYYVVYEPRVLAYYEDPRMLRRFDPRWQYAAAYYNPPPPRYYGYYGYGPYGYAYVSRGPAVLIQRYETRPYTWRRRW